MFKIFESCWGPSFISCVVFCFLKISFNHFFPGELNFGFSEQFYIPLLQNTVQWSPWTTYDFVNIVFPDTGAPRVHAAPAVETRSEGALGQITGPLVAVPTKTVSVTYFLRVTDFRPLYCGSLLPPLRLLCLSLSSSGCRSVSTSTLCLSGLWVFLTKHRLAAFVLSLSLCEWEYFIPVWFTELMDYLQLDWEALAVVADF